MQIRRAVVGVFQENCYIVSDDEGETFLIDPGDEEDRLLAVIEQHQLRVRLIANTHSHADHILAIAPIMRATGCEFVMTAEEDAFLRSRPPTSNAFITVRELPPPPTRTVADGDLIAVGAFRLRVLFTPGHTPGGACYYDEANKVVYTGDTLFQSSIGRTDFPGGNTAQLLTSIRDKLLTLPDDVTILPGHGDPSTIGRERRFNPFLRGL
ncbi:MAG: MBL fold metallo-hydrolase [Chloroflexota bacterium]|nr:MBL fold metallo-hydrolase [Dehalococcoidia bacterium]MDW8254488.1 MBL fold metallo-hydrolase [Chloroflexota bacterium]